MSRHGCTIVHARTKEDLLRIFFAPNRIFICFSIYQMLIFKTGKIKITPRQIKDQTFKNEASVWSYCTVNKLHFDMPEVFRIRLIVEIRHFKSVSAGKSNTILVFSIRIRVVFF